MIKIKYGPNPQGIRELKFNLNWWTTMSTKKQRKSQSKRKRQLQNKTKLRSKRKRRNTKAYSHTTHEKQNSVEIKRNSSYVHHHTSTHKQDGVETEERVTLCIHFSRIGRSINKQEMNGEGSYSLDFKR